MGGECSLKPVEIDVSLRAPSPVALAALVLVVAAAGPLGCRGKASPDDCAAMLEHYLDLAVREAPGGPKMSPAQASAVREVERGLKRAEPSYRRAQDRCESVDRSEVRCATRADTTRAWEACLHREHPPDAE
jgi:hypothetical protein